MIEWNGSGSPVPYMVFSDPNDPDTDNDDLPDWDEVMIWNSFPMNPDSDNDSIKDGHEANNYFFPYGGLTPLSDFDGDNIKGIQDSDSDNDALPHWLIRIVTWYGTMMRSTVTVLTIQIPLRACFNSKFSIIPIH
jgi:hypothetical protein